MALRHIDSFDLYGTSQILNRYTSTLLGANASVTIQSGQGRQSQSLRISHASGGTSTVALTKTIDSQSTWSTHFGMKTTTFASQRDFLSFRDAGSIQVELLINTDGTISATRNGTVLGTTSLSLSINVYYHIQCKVVIHDTTGSVLIKINNAEALNLTSIDTKNTANATANQIYLGNNRLSVNSYTMDIDDLIITDGTGSSPYNGLMGDKRVDAALCNGDGSTTEFTLSTGSSHFALLDENPPVTTDYAESSTVNHVELLTFPDLPTLTSATVDAVQILMFANNPEGGGRTIAGHVKSSAATATGSGFALTVGATYYADIFTQDPNTAGAWTQTTVNAAEFGAKITA